MLYGDTRLRKSSPLKYLESFIAEYSPGYKNKWVVLEQGGEIYNKLAVKNLFQKYGYEILPTSPDASHQNGPVERVYCTISQGIKALLISAVLDIKF